MFLNPFLPTPPPQRTLGGALPAAQDLPPHPLLPGLGPIVRHSVFTVDPLETQDGVPVRVQACVCWQAAPERNVWLGQADTRALLVALASTELAHVLARTLLGDLIQQRGAVDAAWLHALRGQVNDLPLQIDTARLLALAPEPVSEANLTSRCLAAMRALLARAPVPSLQPADDPVSAHDISNAPDSCHAFQPANAACVAHSPTPTGAMCPAPAHAHHSNPGIGPHTR